MDTNEDPLYREVILEHWRHPANHGVVASPSFDTEQANPLCGDHIRLTGIIAGDKLTDIAFTGEGCAVSIASASLLTEELRGRSIKKIRQIGERDALELLGIQLTPARTKCALLAHSTLVAALRHYESAH